MLSSIPPPVPYRVVFAATSKANPFPLAIHAVKEPAALTAMSLLGVLGTHPKATHCVNYSRNWFQMVRVNTTSHATQMVERQAFLDLSTKYLVDDAMRVVALPFTFSAYTEDAVAILYRAHPDPTATFSNQHHVPSKELRQVAQRAHFKGL
jgi:hypothetical protein